MKCSRCRGPARHRFPQHNARFCDGCLEIFFRRQVEKAIKDYGMLSPGQPVLTAVSGGKDSLALWQVLHDLGYDTEGLHLGLDLGPFSEASLASSQEMAARLGRPLHVFNLREMMGCDMAQVVRANRRAFCSVCGSMKRHYLNLLCTRLGAGTIATGHHLDDETGRLLGNLIHRHEHHLERQWPMLPASQRGLAAKIKPLCRLGGDEVKAYAKAKELPVAAGSCPKSKGATLPFYQQAMHLLEQKMPGTKLDFYLSFLRAKQSPPPPVEAPLTCAVCGTPSFVEVCGACRLLAKALRPKPGGEDDALQASAQL